MIIAIDGPAASGKGTLAKAVAARLGLPYLDTGLLYRTVALALSDLGLPTSDAEAATRIARDIDLSRMPPEPSLRRADLGEGASVVSAHPEVRLALNDAQRRFAGAPGGAVLDGRDIGTVICPHADLKVFVVATPEVRAARRFADLAPRTPGLLLEDVLSDIRRRDARDSGRSDAPLARAPGAILVDTTHLGPDACLELVLSHLPGGPPPYARADATAAATSDGASPRISRSA